MGALLQDKVGRYINTNLILYINYTFTYMDLHTRIQLNHEVLFRQLIVASTQNLGGFLLWIQKV
jgi:hypothetical protein